MVSIDFWNTIVETSSGSAKRKKARNDALRAVAQQHKIELSSDDIKDAAKVAFDKFEHVWLNYHRTLTPNHLVTFILEHLKIPFAPNEHHYLVTVFEESFWEAPPAIAEGAKETISQLSKQYQLAIISDTMFSPGRVIRAFLDSENLSKYFQCFVFSNETGYSKPNPNAYFKALQSTKSTAGESYHIGDRVETDILGAQNVGMNTVLFTYFRENTSDEAAAKSDAICQHWSEVGDLLL
jgi:putative hydrolase of the HAD superfamily